MLAQAGIGSRRRMEALISQGRILVNGNTAQLGQRISSTDRVQVDNHPIVIPDAEVETRVLIYHKPAGEIVSRDDPQGRASVFEHMPALKSARWIAVGRLDFNTSGLLLLTTSGMLANVLMHPSSEIEREYAVRIRGVLSESQITQLCTRVDLEDGPAKFERIEVRGGSGANRWYHVTLHEGRNREVRRMFDALGLSVSRLIRVRFGPVCLPPRLRPGRYQEMLPTDKRILTMSGYSLSDQQKGSSAVALPQVLMPRKPRNELSKPSSRLQRKTDSHPHGGLKKGRSPRRVRQ